MKQYFIKSYYSIFSISYIVYMIRYHMTKFFTHHSYITQTMMQYVSKSSTISKAPFILHINRFILNKHVWISYGHYLLQYVRLQHTLWCFKINLPKHLDYQDHTPYLKLALYCIYIVKSTM